jgi:hypothetical protein
VQKILVIFLICASGWSFGQSFEINYGFKFQLLATIGSHQSSFGLGLNTFIGCRYAQINAGSRFRLFGNDLGNRTNVREWRHELGAVVMGGRFDNPINFEYSGALHQQKSAYSLGYAYLWYFDNTETSQRSGTWNIGLGRIDLQFENDVFGGQAKDRFRTGSLVLSYRDSMSKYALGIQLWTGETRNSVWYKDPLDRAPSGYRDLTPLPYGKLNHGILFGEIKYRTDYNQYVGGRIGWDSEQIRHIFQNRLTHDLILLPKSIERNTPHYPRLDENGKIVFSKKEARPAKPYFSVFLNDGGLY